MNNRGGGGTLRMLMRPTQKGLALYVLPRHVKALANRHANGNGTTMAWADPTK